MRRRRRAEVDSGSAPLDRHMNAESVVGPADQAARDRRPHVAVIGGGFCGLATAYELGRHGVRATVLERDPEVGGLAGGFDVGGTRLEKFYHHWFTSDTHVTQLVDELGRSESVMLRPTRTGMYYAHDLFKLSTPIDLLKFPLLGLPDRIRLGLLALRARRIRNWRALEDRTAGDWLRDLGGERVYRVVWEPLLRGKFGDAAEDVAAVWFWNKLKLRGGSRGKGGGEQLAYYRGGFAALADELVKAIVEGGGEVRTNSPVEELLVESGTVTGVRCPDQTLCVDAVVATPSLPVVAGLAAPHVPSSYLDELRRIRYLGNVCVVLELERSLSGIYWLNVNDPTFPFVAVIEHTNFEPADTYDGRRIVYLSKYLPPEDPVNSMPDEAVVDFALKHLREMFPRFDPGWLIRAHVWREPHAQPIVECGYRRMIPDTVTPLKGLFLATMAQVYPEDRGTNYAIRQGREVASRVALELQPDDS